MAIIFKIVTWHTFLSIRNVIDVIHSVGAAT
jgi:hypothetical protein